MSATVGDACDLMRSKLHEHCFMHPRRHVPCDLELTIDGYVIEKKISIAELLKMYTERPLRFVVIVDYSDLSDETVESDYDSYSDESDDSDVIITYA